MTWSFIEHITNQLSAPRFGEQKAPTLWPSSATAIVDGNVIGKCRRQAFIRYACDSYVFSERYAGYEDFYKDIKDLRIPTSTYSHWIFKQGDLYEQFCIDIAKEAGIYIADQVSIYIPAYNVSGKIDLITINPETGLYQIVEVKSIYGFNANSVLGTDAQQRNNRTLGTPRESHLMQIGIYQWWYGNSEENFGPGLLVYGSRDTGRYGEFIITVDKVGDEDYIFYQSNAPVSSTEKINSGITIQSILSNYNLILECLDSKELPDRDYDLLYSESKIEALYQNGELSKADTAQHEKRKKQIQEGKKRIVKPVEKGDWQCRLCEYKKLCYNDDSTPRD